MQALATLGRWRACAGSPGGSSRRLRRCAARTRGEASYGGGLVVSQAGSACGRVTRLPSVAHPFGTVGSVLEGERFWTKVDRYGPVSEHRPDLGPCWLWTAATTGGKGYGSFRVRLADGRRSMVVAQDRKSTRLNSSHVEISYAVFCLKKKKKKNT